MNELSSDRQKRKRQYYAELYRKLPSLKKAQESIAAVIIKETEGDYFGYEQLQRIEKVLWRKEIRHISEVFTGDDYRVLEFLLGNENAALFKKTWDRAVDYPFSLGYFRRSFRTSVESQVHIEHNINRLRYALHFIAQGFRWEPDVLYSEAANYRFLHDFIACELDQSNADWLNKLQEIIYGDNSSGMLTRNIIKGMLMSRNVKAHRLVGELLIAAQLQEGLRQTIVESMDETSREGFIYILRIIIDEELWRFSSIVRAFDVWTGLTIEAMKPAQAKKCLVAAYDCLTSLETRGQYLDNEDSQLLYMALWSTAFDEMTVTHSKIAELAISGPKYRKVVALQFLTQCHAPEFQHQLAIRFMDDPDLEVTAWAIPNLYPDIEMFQLRRMEPSDRNPRQDSSESWKLFRQLCGVLERLQAKSVTISSNGLFPDYQLSADDVCGRMLAVAYDCGELEMFYMLLDYRDKMQPETRTALLKLGGQKPVNVKHRQATFAMLGDKSSDVRRIAYEAVEQLQLTPDEYSGVEDLLQYKTGELRKSAISLLLKQPRGPFLASVSRLLGDKKEEKRLGGLDIVLSLQKNAEAQQLYAECVQFVNKMTGTTARENILIDQIVGKDAELYGPDNGYGLYDPEQKFALPELKPATSRSFLSRLWGDQSSSSPYGLKRILSSSPGKLHAIVEEWSRLIDRHKDYEFEMEYSDGSKDKRIFGTLHGFIPLKTMGGDTLDDYPLADVWRTLAREQKLDVPLLLELRYYITASKMSDFGLSLKTYLSKFSIPTVSQWFDFSAIDKFKRMTDKLPYWRLIDGILNQLFREFDDQEVFQYVYPAAVEVYESLIPAIEKHHKPLTAQEVAFPGPDDYRRFNDQVSFPDVVQAHEIRYWHSELIRVYKMDDGSFEAGFMLLYRYARINERKAEQLLDLTAFARAVESGIITENEMYIELMGRLAGVHHMNHLSRDKVKKELSSFPKARQVIESVLERVVEMELKRGDSDTPVSRLAQKIDRYEGMRHMVQCLLGLGSKDALARGYFYSWGSTTKKDMISHLLKSCFPAPDEDADKLKQLLQGHKISDQRLIDVAMYAPQWVDIIEGYLGWQGLSSACWYFHAHVSEVFSSEKETMVARFSPISPLDLNEGAFDIEWFMDAFQTIGEKRFQLVYESAKYISDGANHRRSQLFADAVLGRLDAAEIESELSVKRNKNHVLCYGLIPLPAERKNETLIHRYEVIQKFAKESKQFGAQRRESETKAVRLALDNLARNAGFADVTRLIWKVEADQFKQISAHFEPITVDQWDISLSIDDQGRASLNVAKDGKFIKSMPDKLKKNEMLLQLKQFQSVLKDQYRRSREALEKAMVMEEPFTAGELRFLQDNKVILPIINSLVFKSGNTLGYFNDAGLRTPDGQTLYLDEEDRVWIAHPVHLYESGYWSVYQRDLISRQVVQPFKQVFRELYRPNEDEQFEGISSLRYAGHQIQPRKAAALFKSRSWTVSHEEGLQKVFHKQDIVATMYAMADWFSPAEVEAPTIETVSFFNRRNGNSIRLTDIPSVIFSEVMRDIDLAVSVAHVGGVDPEASLSTVEMRVSLIRELLPLMKLDNVTVQGSHAHINGSLGEYTIHLGSGIVHRKAAGSLNIVPVHSQHRGKIFLPFVDEDPRTAEIMSKVLLLAEDRKLKDPTILVQLQG